MFPELMAQLTISAGIAENVLVVPVTSVLGAAESGVVYVVNEDGTTEERQVTLGLSDGINVEVIDGLEEGEIVMQFVPGAPRADLAMRRDADRDRLLRCRHRLRRADVAFVELEGVTRSIDLPDGGRLDILKGVDLNVEIGDHVSIVGRSGSGKSTLLNLLGLVDTPTSGRLEFDGTPARQTGSGERDRRRGRDVGFHLPAVQPAARAHGTRERDDPAAVRRGATVLGPPEARERDARSRRPRWAPEVDPRPAARVASSSASRSPAPSCAARG